MENMNMQNAIDNLEKYLIIQRKSYKKAAKMEESSQNNWNKDKEKLNKKYLDLKLEVMDSYKDKCLSFDYAYISIYIGFYDKNIDFIRAYGPEEYLKKTTLEDIKTNYNHYILGNMVTNEFGIRHSLIHTIEAIFDELYIDDDNCNPFKDEKEVFYQMVASFENKNDISDKEKIELVLSIFKYIKERQDKLDKLDKELFEENRKLNKHYQNIQKKQFYHSMNYDEIDDAKEKYIFPIAESYGAEVYEIFDKIINQLVAADQNKFIRLARKRNIVSIDDLYNVLDEAFYGNF